MKRGLAEETGSDSGGGSKKKKVRSDDQQLVRPSEVPEYLRDTEFYRSLDVEDDESFYLPVDFMKTNLEVETLNDACDLLNTARFWGVKEVIFPVGLLTVTQPFKEIKSELRKFKKEFHFMAIWIHVLDDERSLESRMEAAMELGVLEVVKYLEGRGAIYTSMALISATAVGKLPCLEYALRMPTPYCDKSTLPIVAAEYGQFECLQYLHSLGMSLHGCFSAAAASGSLACLKYVDDHFKPRFDRHQEFGVCEAAARNGHLQCLEFAHEQGYPLHGACSAAASAGSEPCLKYAHSHGCTISQDVCTAAATAGSLPCLQYCHENGGGAWSYLVVHAAALHGHLSCLQYAREHGCPWRPATVSAIDKHQYQGQLKVKKGLSYLVKRVAQREHWDCIRYLILQNYPLTVGLSTHLARKHKDSLLQLAMERGCPVSVDVGIRFAKAGNLEGLSYAMQHGCDPSAQILCAAARRGRLDCLIYAHEQGCRWSKEVCMAAARGGHLECLQYAREHRCPWDNKVCVVAAQKKHQHILEYVQQRKCPAAKSLTKR